MISKNKQTEIIYNNLIGGVNYIAYCSQEEILYSEFSFVLFADYSEINKVAVSDNVGNSIKVSIKFSENE